MNFEKNDKKHGGNTIKIIFLYKKLDLKKAILEVKKVSNSSEPQYYIGRRVFAALRDEKE